MRILETLCSKCSLRGTTSIGFALILAVSAPAAPVARPNLSARALVERAIAVYGAAALQRMAAHEILDVDAHKLKPVPNEWRSRILRKGDRLLVIEKTGMKDDVTYSDSRGGSELVDGELVHLSPREYAEAVRPLEHALPLLLRYRSPGFRLALLGAQKLPDGAFAEVVRMTTSAGAATDFYFDPGSGRVSAIGYTAFNHSRGLMQRYLVCFLDYRLFHGSPVSFRQDTYEDGVKTRTVKVLKIDDSPIADRAFQLRPARFPPVLPGRARFAFTQAMILVRVSINHSAPELFQVDSGASITIIRPQFAADLGIPLTPGINLSGAGGGIASQQGVVASVRVGSAEARKVDVAVADSWMFDASGLSGVIGYSFLSRFRVTIDYAKHEIYLDSPRRIGERGGVPMALGSGLPVVEARVNKHEFPMAIDTGADMTVLPAHTAARLGLHVRFHQGATGADGQPYPMDIARAPSLAVGDQNVHGAVVTFAAPGKVGDQMLADRGTGLLGTPFLRRFLVTLDYHQQRVILTPTAYGASIPDAWTHPGIELIEDSFMGARIFGLFKHSPASAAGLRVGQPVTAINGRSTQGMSEDEINNALDGPAGSTVKITILMDGGDHDFILKRVNWL